MKRLRYLLLSGLLMGAACSERAGPPQKRERNIRLNAVVLSKTPAEGGLTGTVRFIGKPPALRAIDMSTDGHCLSGDGGEGSRNDSFVAAATTVDGEFHLANVFIWIEGAELPDSAEGSKPLVIDQKGCRYLPRVSGTRIGNTVQILNSDNTVHNVHNRASKGGFNKVMLAQADPLEVVFEEEELMVQLRCDVHPWMRAYVGVLPHDYHAVSGEDGRFRLPALPPGDYRLRAWHELLGRSEPLPFSVSGEPLKLEIEFSR